MAIKGKHVCWECRTALEGRFMRRKQFCDPLCRAKWNNRRRKRGAELYDIFMCVRFQRGAAKALSLWTLMCAMASWWRLEDAAEGIQSHYGAKEAAQNCAKYRAKLLADKAKGRGTRPT